MKAKIFQLFSAFYRAPQALSALTWSSREPIFSEFYKYSNWPKLQLQLLFFQFFCCFLLVFNLNIVFATSKKSRGRQKTAAKPAPKQSRTKKPKTATKRPASKPRSASPAKKT